MLRLDKLLYAAKRYKMKVILSTTSFFNTFGGMRWWVDSFLGKTFAIEEFYTNEKVILPYRCFLTSLMNRVNTITKRVYKEDDTILAWDLANQIQTKDSVDLSGEMTSKFLCETAEFIKNKIQIKQLLASGEEGYMRNGSQNGIFTELKWINNGVKGVDFEKNLQCSHIDISTIYVFPDFWRVPYSKNLEFIDAYVKERAELAHKYNKPLIVEEFGCCSVNSYRKHRKNVLKNFIDVFYKYNIAGQLIYQLLPDSTNLFKNKNYYDFSKSDDAASFKVIFNAIKNLTNNII
jgi:mannan endo-1,4-beta-mannosidase